MIVGFMPFRGTVLAVLSLKKTKTDFGQKSVLLMTYRMSNITRGPKRAMALTQIFLPFIPNQLVLDQSLSFLAFPLYWNVDSARC
jgi:hypothetical protein